MLFHSFEFIFFFLPIVWIVYVLLARAEKNDAGMLWLLAASYFFYVWWEARYLWILLFSTFFNYYLGRLIANRSSTLNRRKLILSVAIAINIALLFYYKNANLLFGSADTALDGTFQFAEIALPIGISFFTFQQIAYLVDVYKGDTKEYELIKYSLFVSFFPQLIAGPIVHHKALLSQFDGPLSRRISADRIITGITIFIFGLFKKVVIADSFALIANPLFSKASQDVSLTFLEGWSGAGAYSLQLYFDFCGYSDMAIGIGLMFGIVLPLNFNSPYKASSIIDFWRRWHMTLSQFLRDYLYIPLGGNKLGRTRRYLNIMVVMVLGGIWHGAGVTFALWGFIHGLLLAVNHGWRKVRKEYFSPLLDKSHSYIILSRFFTYVVVVFAWVPFRANTLDSALSIWQAMVGQYSLMLPSDTESQLNIFGIMINFMASHMFLEQATQMALIGFATLFVLFAANTNELCLEKIYGETAAIADRPKAAPGSKVWQPSRYWGMFLGLIFAISLLYLREKHEFIYYQF